MHTLERKVGDTINATVAPAKATNVTYAWYTGDSATALNTQIADATSKDLVITADMVGKFVGVVVTGDNNSTANAVTAVAVAEADAADLRIVDAKQSGAKTVKLTFSNAVTASDKITAKRGNNEVKVENVDFDADFKGATVTLADKIIAGEYTITLTPADTKIKASEAKFTGEVSELKEIKFLNKYLVMKNQYYNEGYCYVKGYDQFGGQVNLSGLTVTPGVGTYTAYDTDTGKITISDKAHQDPNTGDFLLIKEVPVFVQYQQGNNVLTANETLTVSTRSYVNDLEFGEIKKDGTMREDKKLTMAELGSGKYYVELTKVKDQYDNDLSADDLNKQLTDNVLFVIPGDSGAFYKTNKFGTMNGKTVLWIDKVANGKPGTMALSITGTGGKTFSKDITIEDNPYIQTLNVTYPELYYGSTDSAKFEFTAVDQYGTTLDAAAFYEFKPIASNSATVPGGTAGVNTDYLVFNDTNNMTGSHTYIKASAGAFKEVKYDSTKKSFTVKFAVGTTTKAKNPVVFTLTTAGMTVGTQSITVGEQGTASKIKSTLGGGNRQLVDAAVGKDSDYNFNEHIRFEDANGNSMGRGDADYPVFTTGITAANIKDVTANAAYAGYAWSLSDKKITVGNGNTATFDNDGNISATEYNTLTNGDVYATLYGINGANYEILDDETFHLTKASGTETSYTVSVDKNSLLYAVPGSNDSEEIIVEATTNQGSTYRVARDRVKAIVSGDFIGDNDTVKANLKDKLADNTEGTVNVKVNVGTTEEGTVAVKYSNKKPVPSSTSIKFYTNKDGGTSKIGKDFDGDTADRDFDATNVGIVDGELTLKNANDLKDTIKASVKDQYDQVMTDTVFYIDSKKAYDGMTLTAGQTYTVQFTNGSQGEKLNVKPAANITVRVTNTKSTGTVSDMAGLESAAAIANADSSNAYNIAVTGNISTGKAFTVPSNVTLTVEEGAIFNVTTGALTNDGTIINNGTVNVGVKGSALGNFTNNKTVNLTDATTEAGDAYTVAAGKTFTNNGTVVFGTNNERIDLVVNGKFVNNSDAQVKEDVAGVTSYVSGAGTFTNKSGGTVTLDNMGMVNNETFENFGVATITNISGYALLGNESQTTATSYTATTTVPKQSTATLRVGITEEILGNTSSSADWVATTGNGTAFTTQEGALSEKTGATVNANTASIVTGKVAGATTAETLAALKKVEGFAEANITDEKEVTACKYAKVSGLVSGNYALVIKYGDKYYTYGIKNDATGMNMYEACDVIGKGSANAFGDTYKEASSATYNEALGKVTEVWVVNANNPYNAEAELTGDNAHDPITYVAHATWAD